MKKLLITSVSLLVFIFILIVLFDQVYMPWFVKAEEIVVPKVEGLYKEEAINVLEENGLKAIEKGTKFDTNYEIDEIMFQNPSPGSVVKKGRNVYLVISGGEPQIKVPRLINKTLRDVKITLARFNLALGEIKEVRSELPKNVIVEQYPEPNMYVEKGDKVDINISIGPKRGMVRTPVLIGKSLSEARKILRRNSLNVGRISRKRSPSVLPNTICEQSPNEGEFLFIGDSVNVTITISD